MSFPIYRAVCLSLLIFGLSVPVSAQGIRRPNRQRNPEREQPPTDPFAAEGTIQVIAPGKIGVLTNTNQKWLVWIAPKAKIHVKGTAGPDFLKPGMFVRFTAPINKRGEAEEKIRELTVITPSEQNPLGVWPEGFGPDQKQTPDEEGFGAPASSPAESTVFTVAGRLGGTRRSKLTANTGRDVVRFDLAEEATVSLDFADYSVAGKGDRISITKGKMPRGRLGVAQASELTIELTRSLGEEDEKEARSDRNRDRGKKRRREGEGRNRRGRQGEGETRRNPGFGR